MNKIQLTLKFDIYDKWEITYEAEGYTNKGTLDGIIKIWREEKPTYDEAMNLYKLLKGEKGYTNIKIKQICQDGNN